MSPGRELDTLVAEKVMGRIVSLDPLWMKIYETPDAFVETSQSRAWRRWLHPYSTDIAAAWEVVEKLCDVELRDGWDGKRWWRCTIGHKHASARAYSAPHAICLAALKAVRAI